MSERSYTDSEPMNVTEPIRCGLARAEAGHEPGIEIEDIAALLAAYDRLALAQPAPDLTNHHNALKCPHCNPNDAVRKAVIEECAQELEASYPDHAAINAYCAAIRSLAPRAVGCTVPISDEELAGWARSWHWNDTAADQPVDPSIYFRDIRMLKAFIAKCQSTPSSTMRGATCPCGTGEESCPNADGVPLCAAPRPQRGIGGAE